MAAALPLPCTTIHGYKFIDYIFIIITIIINRHVFIGEPNWYGNFTTIKLQRAKHLPNAKLHTYADIRNDYNLNTSIVKTRSRLQLHVFHFLLVAFCIKSDSFINIAYLLSSSLAVSLQRAATTDFLYSVQSDFVHQHRHCTFAHFSALSMQLYSHCSITCGFRSPNFIFLRRSINF